MYVVTAFGSAFRHLNSPSIESSAYGLWRVGSDEPIQ